MEQYFSEIITALVSVAVSYGAMKAEIRNMKQKIERYDKDHDLLVELNTKIDMILKNQRSKK
jgi:hypothetical protein